MPNRDQRFPNAIVHSADDFIVAAEMAAEKLGLSPDTFWGELKRGIVYGVVERGEGDDAGRTRLTFRYRARSWSVILEGQMTNQTDDDSTGEFIEFYVDSGMKRGIYTGRFIRKRRSRLR